MKRLIFTEHALQRLEQRKIKRDLVIVTVSSPDFVVVREEASEAYKHFKKRLLKAVYVEKETFIRIITLYWVNGDEPESQI